VAQEQQQAPVKQEVQPQAQQNVQEEVIQNAQQESQSESLVQQDTSVQYDTSVQQKTSAKQTEDDEKGTPEDKAEFVTTIGKIVNELNKIGDVSSTEGKAYKTAFDGIREVYKELQKAPYTHFDLAYKQYALRAINYVKRDYERTHPRSANASSTQKEILKVFSLFDVLAKKIGKEIAGEIPFLSPAEVLSQGKFPDYMEAMEAAPDFVGKGKIPEGIMLSCPVETLEKFKKEHWDELNSEEKKYLDGRIASEQFYEDLRNNPAQPILTDPVTEGGRIELKHIHQTEFQSTRNGCYSAAVSLLLQSRGLHLNQKLVRAFRGDSGTQSERITSDEMANAGSLGGIAATGLVNTGMIERTYPNPFNNVRDDKKVEALDDIKKHILTSLLFHKSPVALLVGYHYVTVVGYDFETEKLLVKNSMEGGGRNDPDKTYEISLKGLANAHRISLSYLLDIKPDKPLEAIEGIKNKEFLEMIGDGISFNEAGVFGVPKLHGEGTWRQIGDAGDISSPDFNVSVEARLPEKLYIPAKMKKTTETPVQKEKLLQERKKELLFIQI